MVLEPSWKLMLLFLSVYTENVIYGNEIKFTEIERSKFTDEEMSGALTKRIDSDIEAEVEYGV
jgi:hypothetical protein